MFYSYLKDLPTRVWIINSSLKKKEPKEEINHLQEQQKCLYITILAVSKSNVAKKL